MDKYAIIDFEFTGLNNEYIKDNEIIQTKFLVVENGKSVFHEYKHQHTKPSTAGAFSVHHIKDHIGTDPVFSKTWYENHVYNVLKDIPIYSFSPGMDRKLLINYGVATDEQFKVIDIQDMLRLDPKYELTMATGGASMEACYYMLFGELADLKNHGGAKEMYCIQRILDNIINNERNEFLTYVPWGYMSGMPIDKYVVKKRKGADGYRYNNDDLFAKSLTAAIDNDSSVPWE